MHRGVNVLLHIAYNNVRNQGDCREIVIWRLGLYISYATSDGHKYNEIPHCCITPDNN